jgi:hypothetical protein
MTKQALSGQTLITQTQQYQNLSNKLKRYYFYGSYHSKG